jgi:hypothetical protein
MPGRLKFVVAMFAQGGLTLVRKIRRVGYNVLDRRPTVGKQDGPGIVLRSAFDLIGFGARTRRAPLRVPGE